MRVLLDPTGELAAETVASAPRLDSLSGKTIALLDISKPRGSVFLDRVEQLLVASGTTVERYRKDSYARVASEDLRALIGSRCSAVIEALAD